MLQPDMGSIFHIKKSMKNSGHRKLLCELSKLSKFNAFNLLGYWTNTDASILVYKFRQERTGFNMYAKYTQLQLIFLALQPWAGLGWIFNWIQIEIRETNPKRCITRFRYWQAPYNGGGVLKNVAWQQILTYFIHGFKEEHFITKKR